MTDPDIAISVQNLGKSYRLWNDPRDRLKQPLRSMLSRWLPIENKHYFKEFWALKDISFDVKKGEMVAFIGRNGAGKSTLLQIICGTLSPTCGTYETHGRISALLELGSGFNLEFTGSENVYMNASILGLTKEEIDERYESIVEFADIGQFIDQPVKTYSSGMFIRLAFSVAISVEPDLLVVDEALAVGDIKFTVKCYDKIRELRAAGRSILFVSHDLNSVNTFCDRAYYLRDGSIVMHGEPKDVTGQYYNDMFAKEKTDSRLHDHPSKKLGKPQFAVTEAGNKYSFIPPPTADKISAALERKITLGNGKARIVDYAVYSTEGNPVNVVDSQSLYLIHIRVYALEDIDHYQVSFLVRDSKGIMLYGIGTHTDGIYCPTLKRYEARDFFFEVTFSCINFPFLITVSIAHDEIDIIDRIPDALIIYTEPDWRSFPNSIIRFDSRIELGSRHYVGHIEIE